MKLRIIFTFLILIFICNSFAAKPLSGTDLEMICGDSRGEFICDMYFLGYLDGFAMKSNMIENSNDYIKKHGRQLTAYTLIKSYLKFMKEMPEVGDFPAGPIVGKVLDVIGYAKGIENQ